MGPEPYQFVQDGGSCAACPGDQHVGDGELLDSVREVTINITKASPTATPVWAQAGPSVARIGVFPGRSKHGFLAG